MQDLPFTSEFIFPKLVENDSKIIRKKFQDLKDAGYKEYSIDEYLNLIDGLSTKEKDHHIFEDWKKHKNVEYRILVRNLYVDRPECFWFSKEDQ